MPALHVLLLAAGRSLRLGRSKALATVRGTSLLLRTVRLLGGLGAAPPTIVAPPRCTRFRHELRGQRVRLVENPRRAAGLSSSLQIGVRRLRWTTALLILPVDLAGLRRDDLQRLIRRWRGSRRKLTGSRLGHGGGAPLILPKWAYGAAAASRGDAGLRGFMATLGADRRVLIDLRSVVADVDTPAQLRAARRRFPARRAP